MRGDLGLMVKQQSVTGFNVKLTPMGTLECPYSRVPTAVCCISSDLKLLYLYISKHEKL